MCLASWIQANMFCGFILIVLVGVCTLRACWFARSPRIARKHAWDVGIRALGIHAERGGRQFSVKSIGGCTCARKCATKRKTTDMTGHDRCWMDRITHSDAVSYTHLRAHETSAHL
eukprot:2312157-Alexandrium_andersonii.AAC.1